MRKRNGAWLAVGFVLALSACEDEILTDVDLPKDASADRGTDAPKEGASADSPAATDGGPDERTSADDGSSSEGGDSADEGGDSAATDDATPEGG
jgi:hypothetical protein